MTSTCRHLRQKDPAYIEALPEMSAYVKRGTAATPKRQPFTRNVRDAYSTIRAIALVGEVTLEDPDATILFVDIHT